QQAPDFDLWVRVSELFDVGFINTKVMELRDHPLQLSKVGQKQMTTIEEELPVINRIQESLSGIVTEYEFTSLWKRERGRQHIHWLVRALMRLDFDAAVRGWQAVKRYGHPWQQLAFWLVSCNGRLFARNSHSFFDKKMTHVV